MSLYDYQKSQEISARGEPFYALIMAAMRQADSNNVELLKQAFPDVWDELRKRYHAPGGLIEGDPVYERLRAEQQRIPRPGGKSWTPS